MVISSSTTTQTGFLRSGPIVPSEASNGSSAALPTSSESTRAGWEPRPVAAFAVIQVSPTPRPPNITPHIALPHTIQRGRNSGLRTLQGSHAPCLELAGTRLRALFVENDRVDAIASPAAGTAR